MIKKIQLKNFKCFSDTTIPLANLTLMTGLNGMGKSSAIQSLLVLRQSFQQGLFPDRGLALNGDLIDLGTAKAVLFEDAQKDEIGITIMCDPSDHSSSFLFKYDKQADTLGILQKSIATEFLEQSLFSDRFQYIRAERLEPRVMFPVSNHSVREHRQLGFKGEFTSHFLELFGKELKVLKKMQHEQGRSGQLIHQVAAWLGEISPGVDIHFSSYENMDIVNLEYSFSATGTRKFRAPSVGFGITYTLPIIVAILSAQPGDLLILENPEAHIHPQGQVRIGELLARAANEGVELIVETHSDHILNGIRVAVRQGRCASEKVAIHFFSRTQKDGHAYSSIDSPVIDKLGRITPWPEGFFDEWEKSLENLF